MSKTVIIGGVAGGATAAARLRRRDESMEIVMLEKGEYISFIDSDDFVDTENYEKFINFVLMW